MRATGAGHAEARGVRGVFAEYIADDVTVEPATEDVAIVHWGRVPPDVMLMDVHNRECNGIEATPRLRGTNPRIGILVVTMYEDDDSVFAAMRAGARAGLQNGAPSAETLRAVRAVASREAIFRPANAQRLRGFCSAVQPKTRIFSELTDREREILALIAQGRRNEEIAAHLCLSIKTVRNHASNIFSKLQVVDRTQAAIRAREAGFA